MPSISVSVELDDAELAELAVWAEFFEMTQADLIADALRSGLDLRRAEYEYEQAPPPRPGLRPGELDDDLPF